MRLDDHSVFSRQKVHRNGIMNSLIELAERVGRRRLLRLVQMEIHYDSRAPLSQLTRTGRHRAGRTFDKTINDVVPMRTSEEMKSGFHSCLDRFIPGILPGHRKSLDVCHPLGDNSELSRNPFSMMTMVEISAETTTTSLVACPLK